MKVFDSTELWKRIRTEEVEHIFRDRTTVNNLKELRIPTYPTLLDLLSIPFEGNIENCSNLIDSIKIQFSIAIPQNWPGKKLATGHVIELLKPANEKFEQVRFQHRYIYWKNENDEIVFYIIGIIKPQIIVNEKFEFVDIQFFILPQKAHNAKSFTIKSSELKEFNKDGGKYSFDKFINL